jgi:hypothetical protein
MQPKSIIPYMQCSQCFVKKRLQPCIVPLGLGLGLELSALSHGKSPRELPVLVGAAS